ncbi:hypothetical protein [Mycobacterium asiaticum]|uniref:hypothetical protein n=1 Tax=Mycobacterium asiaticum TaxID=1790 RepID=UPI0007EFBB4F|nr:hypothetical protein [Mycobacterium asiaticum]OBI92887.1 hypothetical protein A5661_24975 [Mycobacterium asiaticum]
MSIRDWVVDKLREGHFDNRQPMTVEALGQLGVKVTRPGRPDAIGYCAEPDSENPLTAGAVRQAATDLPDLGMVIVIRRLVDPEVYDVARTLGIAVETFPDFVKAIDRDDDIAQYVSAEERYLRRRLTATGFVVSISRCGHRAWEVVRRSGLRSLKIVTHDRYELTDDDFIEVLDHYPRIEPDALVITNPNARGFGDRVLRSAERAGVPVYTLGDFLDRIRSPWT